MTGSRKQTLGNQTHAIQNPASGDYNATGGAPGGASLPAPERVHTGAGSPTGTPVTASNPSEADAADGVRVPLAFAGQRLDKALVALFSAHTRARLQDWLESGHVQLDGRTGVKASYRLRGGEWLQVQPQAPEHMVALTPEPLAFDVVHEDEACIVVNKPAGLVVHPAAGHWSGTLMNGLLHRFPELVDVPRAGIVHRLDKDTTGLMVVARRAGTQQYLIRQMAKRRIRRIYLALVWGRMTQRRTVEAAIGRDPRNRQKMAVVGHGKPAITHFHPLAIGQLADLPVTLLACKLETGRTHQIRVHALHAGFGLVGDETYRQRGARAVPFTRQALHATYLAFHTQALSATEEGGLEPSGTHWEVRTIAELPDDCVTLLHSAGIEVPSADALLNLPTLWPEADEAAWDDDDDLGEESGDDEDIEIIYVRDED